MPEPASSPQKTVIPRAPALRYAVVGLLVGGAWLASVSFLILRVNRADEIRESVMRIHILVLETRRSEKNFMLRSLKDREFYERGDSRYLTFHKERMAELHQEVAHLGTLLPAEGLGRATELPALVARYETAFHDLRDAYRKQGFKDWGLEGEWRRAAHELEQSFTQAGDLALQNRLLQLRRKEKDYVLRRDAADAEEVFLLLGAIRQKAGQRGAALARQWTERLGRYERAFREYVALDEKAGRTRHEGIQAEFQSAIDAVEPATEELLRVTVAETRRAGRLNLIGILLASVLMAVLLGATLFFSRLSRLEERQLLAINRKLEEEIAQRQRAQEALRQAHDELEARVQSRTAELAHVNQALASELSERQKLEAQLLQAQKMDAVGRLAGGVAHDFNNLLMIILGHCELLLDRTAADPAADKSARRIQEAANRAGALTRQLLAFSRKQVLQPRVLDLNGVVTEIEKMLRRLIGENIELVSALAPDLGRVRADLHQIEQVIMNIAVNARDAMPRGGALRIATANITVDETTARKHVGLRPGNYVTLTLADSGIGMDAETLNHVFEPFFTTKELGRGTGLGLATTYGIIKQSQGYISVESAPGRGATFRIYLPRVEDTAEPAKPEAAREELPRGSETVLLVEDETHLRSVARDFLEKAGYTVLEAATGADALEAAQRHAGQIQVLITDVIMPGMSGPELADQLREGRPQLLVVFISGYTDDALATHGVTESDTAFLPKPFSREALLRKVRELLDRPGPSYPGPAEGSAA